MFAAEYIVFALMLLGIALFHRVSMQIAFGGMLTIVGYKLAFTDFLIIEHIGHELNPLLNLAGLLLGFALLAEYFHRAKADLFITKILPNDWRGPLVLLWLVAILSSVLDNIAGAMIGNNCF